MSLSLSESVLLMPFGPLLGEGLTSWLSFSLNIFYLINSLHVYKQEHTYKSITEFINWDSERSLDDLFKSVSQQI